MFNVSYDFLSRFNKSIWAFLVDMLIFKITILFYFPKSIDAMPLFDPTTCTYSILQCINRPQFVCLKIFLLVSQIKITNGQ